MSLERALAGYWQSVSALHALVGVQIYPIIAAQRTVLPYLTWQQLSWRPTYHMGGRSNLFHATVQVDAFARTSPEIEQLQSVFLATTDAAYQKALQGIGIRRMAILNSLDVPESPEDGGQQGIFHRAIDLEIWYRDIT